jgi:hypothetical protein
LETECKATPEAPWASILGNTRRQLLVVLSNGLGISYLRPPEWILSLPEHEWALEQVWMERVGTDGNLWSAVQNMRALETELVVLECLASNEYRPIREDRKKGHDWHLAKDNADFYLEVKSQGEVHRSSRFHQLFLRWPTTD